VIPIHHLQQALHQTAWIRVFGLTAAGGSPTQKCAPPQRKNDPHRPTDSPAGIGVAPLFQRSRSTPTWPAVTGRIYVYKGQMGDLSL
jgi:hypothetical protein